MTDSSQRYFNPSVEPRFAHQVGPHTVWSTHPPDDSSTGFPDGWPPEPKGITQAEVLLYRELAGAVRLAGQAADAAQQAYGLICREIHALMDRGLTVAEGLEQLMTVAYRQQADVVGFHRYLARAALEYAEKGARFATEADVAHVEAMRPPRGR